MARNSLGREVPGRLARQAVRPLPATPGPGCRRWTGRRGRWCGGTRARARCCRRCAPRSRSRGLRDGMTIATHHHLRNGDLLLNLIVQELDAMGFRDIAHRLELGPPGARRDDPVRSARASSRGCETGVNGLIGELATQGRARLPDRRALPRRPRAVAGDRRGAGGRRLHRRAVLRRDGQPERRAAGRRPAAASATRSPTRATPGRWWPSPTTWCPTRRRRSASRRATSTTSSRSTRSATRRRSSPPRPGSPATRPGC